MAEDDITIVRIVKIIFDGASADQVEREMSNALGDAGEKGAKTFLRELRAEFDKRMAKLREDLARGIIDEDEFRKRSNDAARAFNTGLLASMDKARKAGQLTDKEYVKLTRTLKNVGIEGGKSASMLSSGFTRLAGQLAALVTVQKTLSFLSDAIRTAAAEAGIYKDKTDQLRSSWDSFKLSLGSTILSVAEATGALKLIDIALQSYINWHNAVRRLFESEEETQKRLRAALEGNERDMSLMLQLQAKGITLEQHLREEREKREAAEREAEEKRQRAIDTEIQQLVQLNQLHLLRRVEIERALAIERELGREVLTTQEQRIRNQQRFLALQPITGIERGRVNLGVEGQRVGPITPALADIPPIPLDPIRLVGDEHERQAERARNAWQAAYDVIVAEQETQIRKFVGAAQALAEGGIKGLARYARGKVFENIASAIEEIAKGLAKLSNPITAPFAHFNFESAGEHTAAAGAWGLLAGFAGGGGSGKRSGGGNVPSAGAANTRAAGETQPGSEIHIHFVGPDIFNPQLQQAILGAVNSATERQGNATVYTHRRRN